MAYKYTDKQDTILSKYNQETIYETAQTLANPH